MLRTRSPKLSAFRSAESRLAARSGLELRYEQGGQVPGREHSQRRRLLEAHKVAAEFYAERLHSPAAAPGRAFLAERGFTLADAEHFGVGYAPAEHGRKFGVQFRLLGGMLRQ